MTVLTCPVCRAAMREVSKNGVLIDTCSQCRGVWLDRGELEKLSALVGAPDGDRDSSLAGGGFLSGAPLIDRGSSSRQVYHRDDDDDDDDRYSKRRHDGDYGKHKKSKVSRLLDFFD